MAAETLSLFELFEMFPDNATAERWLENERWPDGQRRCPDCGSADHQVVPSRKPMPYRCRDCRAYFSVRKGTCMQSSKLSHRTWVLALYIVVSETEFSWVFGGVTRMGVFDGRSLVRWCEGEVFGVFGGGHYGTECPEQNDYSEEYEPSDD